MAGVSSPGRPGWNKNRTRQTRFGLAALMAVWIFIWAVIGASAESQETAPRSPVSNPNDYLIALAILFAVLGVALVAILLKSQKDNAIRFGVISTFVVLVGTALAGLYLAGEAPDRLCTYSTSWIPEECLEHKSAAESLGWNIFAAASASTVLAGFILSAPAVIATRKYPQDLMRPDQIVGNLDIPGQLRQLSALRESGALSESEYRVAKQRLLDMGAGKNRES